MKITLAFVLFFTQLQCFAGTVDTDDIDNWQELYATDEHVAYRPEKKVVRQKTKATMITPGSVVSEPVIQTDAKRQTLLFPERDHDFLRINNFEIFTKENLNRSKKALECLKNERQLKIRFRLRATDDFDNCFQ
jgi:hypothetical protein